MKPSEIFEGENSSLKNTFDEAVAHGSMTYTEKMLEEFDEKYSDIFYKINKKGSECTENKNIIKSFLSTSIQQAEQEIEVKVRLEIFQMLHKRIMETKDLNQIDILELLQKELLDNLKE